jgi:RecA/RadA recombinase
MPRSKQPLAPNGSIVIGNSGIDLAGFYSQLTKQIEIKQHIITAEMSARTRLSTGILVMDLLFGGGILPCMIQISGLEASGKTTLLLHVLRSALKNAIPWIGLWDAEGSITEKYANSILIDYSMRELSEGLSKRVNYYRRNILEEFYDFLALLLQQLPDIVYHKELGWLYQMPKNNTYFSKMISVLGLRPDKGLSNNPNYWYCPGASGGIQGIMFIDSYASLVVRAVDEQSKGMNRRAIKAGAFSEHIERIIGRLMSKGFAVFGTNQIRTNPAARHGANPEYEPGGIALAQYASVRCQSRSRSTPKEWDTDKQTYQAIEESAFIEGASDRYSFKMFKNTKNKFDTPLLQAWVRIWTRDHEGVGHGIDPVLDVIEYARLTNQLQGNPTGKKGFRIPVGPLSNITFDFYTFKCMILAEVFQDRPLWQWVAAKTGLTKPVMLQQYFFKQLASGETSKLIGTTAQSVVPEFDLTETGGESTSERVLEI